MFGIVEPRSDGEIPGTVHLIEKGDETTPGAKYGTGKYARTILIPRPTDDPNDPLNWPRWKKFTVFVVIFYNTIVFASTPSPLIASSIFVLANALHKPLAQISQLSGYQLLVVGLYGPFASALARKYGKRPQYLFANIMGVIGTTVCVASGDDYQKLLTGRLIQGFGVTAYESLSIAAMADIYFLHERTLPTGLLVLAITTFASFVSIVGGPITNNLGWRYMFIIYLPFTIVGFLATVFFVPETQFRRPVFFSGPSTGSPAPPEDKSTSEGVTHMENSGGTPIQYKKVSYLQSLAPFSGVYTDTNLVRLIVTPFIMLANPLVFWTILVGSIPLALYVGLNFIFAQIWSVPPYNLDATQNGLFWFGAVIGGAIGAIAGSWIIEKITILLTKANKGTLEAEFRIPIEIFVTFLYGIGFFLLSSLLASRKPNAYYLGSFCCGCICAGITISLTVCSLYILDAFPRQRTEIFILQMTSKSLLFFGMSLFVNSWEIRVGGPEVFRVFGIVALSMSATCIPIYSFGKHIRRVVNKIPFLIQHRPWRDLMHEPRPWM